MNNTSFYGGIPGQSFRIYQTYPNKVALIADLPNIPINAYCFIAYGDVKSKEYKRNKFIDNKVIYNDITEDNMGDHELITYNGTFWQKTENLGVESDLKLLAYLTGNTPEIHVKGDIKLTPPHMIPHTYMNTKDVDNPVLSFDFPRNARLFYTRSEDFKTITVTIDENDYISHYININDLFGESIPTVVFGEEDYIEDWDSLGDNKNELNLPNLDMIHAGDYLIHSDAGSIFKVLGIRLEKRAEDDNSYEAPIKIYAKVEFMGHLLLAPESIDIEISDKTFKKLESGEITLEDTYAEVNRNLNNPYTNSAYNIKVHAPKMPKFKIGKTEAYPINSLKTEVDMRIDEDNLDGYILDFKIPEGVPLTFVGEILRYNNVVSMPKLTTSSIINYVLAHNPEALAVLDKYNEIVRVSVEYDDETSESYYIYMLQEMYDEYEEDGETVKEHHERLYGAQKLGTSASFLNNLIDANHNGGLESLDANAHVTAPLKFIQRGMINPDDQIVAEGYLYYAIAQYHSGDKVVILEYDHNGHVYLYEDEVKSVTNNAPSSEESEIRLSRSYGSGNTLYMMKIADGTETPQFKVTHNYAFGENAFATGPNAFAEGKETIAHGVGSHAEGHRTVATNRAHAEGRDTRALSDAAHAEGNQTIAKTGSSHSEGRLTVANGIASHSEGDNTITSGDYSHSEGFYTKVNGKASHIEGFNNISFGNYTHIEGSGNRLLPSDYLVELYTLEEKSFENFSYVITYNDNGWPKVKGTFGDLMPYSGPVQILKLSVRDNNSLLELVQANVIYNLPKSELQLTNATYSFLENWDKNESDDRYYLYFYTLDTKEDKNASHIEGLDNIVKSSVSHVEGQGNIAIGDYQHIQGKYSDSDSSYAFLIGDGTDEENRHNLFGVKWNGEIELNNKPLISEDGNIISNRLDEKYQLNIPQFLETDYRAPWGFFPTDIGGQGSKDNIVLTEWDAAFGWGNLSINGLVLKLKTFDPTDNSYEIDYSNMDDDYILNRIASIVSPITPFTQFIRCSSKEYVKAHVTDTVISTDPLNHNKKLTKIKVQLADGETGSLSRATDIVFPYMTTGKIFNKGGNLAIGYNNISTFQSITTGESNVAQYDSFASGLSNSAMGYQSMASGQYNEAWGEASIALGRLSKAYSNYSFAVGLDTQATGKQQFVMGVTNEADSSKAFIIGNGNHLTGVRSNALTVDWDGNLWLSGNITFGEDGKTLTEKIEELSGINGLNFVNGSALGSIRGVTAKEESDSYSLGMNSFAFGNMAEVYAANSFGFGNGVSINSISDSSIAMGYSAKVNGTRSIAIGSNASASGSFATAIGTHAMAQNDYSVAIGFGTKTTGNFDTVGQMVLGCCNDVEGSAHKLFVIGNGGNLENRSNALTLDYSGNLWVAGNITYGNNNTSLSEGIVNIGDIKYSAVEQDSEYWLQCNGQHIPSSCTELLNKLGEPNFLDNEYWGDISTDWALPTYSYGNYNSGNKSYLIGTYWDQANGTYNLHYSSNNGESWKLITLNNFTLSSYQNILFNGLSADGIPHITAMTSDYKIKDIYFNIDTGTIIKTKTVITSTGMDYILPSDYQYGANIYVNSELNNGLAVLYIYGSANRELYKLTESNGNWLIANSYISHAENNSNYSNNFYHIILTKSGMLFFTESCSSKNANNASEGDFIRYINLNLDTNALNTIPGGQPSNHVVSTIYDTQEDIIYVYKASGDYIGNNYPRDNEVYIFDCANFTYTSTALSGSKLTRSAQKTASGKFVRYIYAFSLLDNGIYREVADDAAFTINYQQSESLGTSDNQINGQLIVDGNKNLIGSLDGGKIRYFGYVLPNLSTGFAKGYIKIK